MAGIPFHRYVYGKIVGTIGGSVEAGFEHEITCATRSFPNAALKFCDPTHRIDSTRLRSTRMLVHPAVQRQQWSGPNTPPGFWRPSSAGYGPIRLYGRTSRGDAKSLKKGFPPGPIDQDIALPGADSQVWSMLDALKTIGPTGARTSRKI